MSKMVRSFRTELKASFMHILYVFSVQNLMIDEADEAMPGQQSSRKRSAAESPSSPRPNKRKPGTFNH